MARIVIMFLIYAITIFLGTIFFVLISFLFDPLNILELISLTELFFFLGLTSGLYSLPIFLIYIFHFNSKKITHQKFIKQSIYFINFSIICYSLIFFVEKPTDPLSYILLISFILSFNISALIFKYLPGEDVQN